MARKAKIEPIKSENFEVLIDSRNVDSPEVYKIPGRAHTYELLWVVRDRVSLSEAGAFTNFDDYGKLKRVWRRSKTDFDSACRNMDFNTLFTAAGIKL